MGGTIEIFIFIDGTIEIQISMGGTIENRPCSLCDKASS
jgi:hypothetical protein